jgi:WD40 repeat protein
MLHRLRSSFGFLLGLLAALGVHSLPAADPFRLERHEALKISELPITSLNWNGSTSLLSAGSLDGGVHVWLLKGEPKLVGQFAARKNATLSMVTEGRRLSAAGIDAGATLWLLPGERIGSIGSFADNKILAIAAEPQSQQVAVLSAGRILIYPRGGSEPLQPELDNSSFNSLAWLGPSAADPLRLAAACDDGRVAIWTWVDGNPTDAVVLHLPRNSSNPALPQKPLCLAAAPAASSFITGDSDGFVRTWLPPPPMAQTPPISASIKSLSQDGRFVITFAQDKLAVVSAANLSQVKSADRPGSAPLILDHVQVDDERHLVAGAWKEGGEQSVEVYDFSGGAPFQKKFPAAQPVRAVAVNHLGTQVAVARQNKDIELFALPANDAVANPAMDFDKSISLLRYAGQDARLVALGSKVSLYDAIERKLLNVSDEDLPAFTHGDIAFDESADGPPQRATLLLASGKTLRLVPVTFEGVDFSKPKIGSSQSFKIANDEITAVHLTDGRALVGTKSEAFVLQVDAQANTLVPLERLTFANPVVSAVIQEGTVVVLTDRVAQRSIAAGELASTGVKPLTLVARNQAGTSYAADAEGKVMVVMGSSAQPLPGAPQKVLAMALSPSGKFLLASLESGVLRSWQVDEAIAEPRDSQAIASPITALSFDPDSNSFFLGCQNGGLGRFGLGGEDPLADRRLEFAPVGAAPYLPIVGVATLPGGSGASGVERFFAADSGRLAVYCLNAEPAGAYQASALDDDVLASPLYSLNYSRDRKSVAIAAADGAVRIHGAPVPSTSDASFNPVAQTVPLQTIVKPSDMEQGGFPAPLYAVTPPTGDPSVTYVAGAGGKLYRLEGGALASGTSSGPAAAVFALAAHPKFDILAVGKGAWLPLTTLNQPLQPLASPEPMLSVWTKGNDPEFARVWPGHTASITAVAFSGEGQLLASVDRSGILRVWDCSGLSFGVAAEPAPFVQAGPLAATPLSLCWVEKTGPSKLAVGCNDGQVHIFSVIPN